MALPHTKNIFSYPARFQFGQSGAPCGGSSCCTDTCIQMIVEYYKEKTYSLATIRRLAQTGTSYNEAPCTGINSVEVLNALNRLGIHHYRVAKGVDANFVKRKVAIGPVLVGVHYGSYPTKKGKCYSRGIKNAEISGKTDCPFRGAHAVLAIGQRPHLHSDGTFAHTDFFTRDPDHHSPARPEKPAYDRITGTSLGIAMKNLPKYTRFSSTYVIYPTQKKGA